MRLFLLLRGRREPTTRRATRALRGWLRWLCHWRGRREPQQLHGRFSFCSLTIESYCLLKNALRFSFSARNGRPRGHLPGAERGPPSVMSNLSCHPRFIGPHRDWRSSPPRRSLIAEPCIEELMGGCRLRNYLVCSRPSVPATSRRSPKRPPCLFKI